MAELGPFADWQDLTQVKSKADFHALRHILYFGPTPPFEQFAAKDFTKRLSGPDARHCTFAFRTVCSCPIGPDCQPPDRLELRCSVNPRLIRKTIPAVRRAAVFSDDAFCAAQPVLAEGLMISGNGRPPRWSGAWVRHQHQAAAVVPFARCVLQDFPTANECYR